MTENKRKQILEWMDMQIQMRKMFVENEYCPAGDTKTLIGGVYGVHVERIGNLAEAAQMQLEYTYHPESKFSHRYSFRYHGMDFYQIEERELNNESEDDQ